MAWWWVHKTIFLPRLVAFRPEDCALPVSESDFDRAIDHVVFLLESDPAKFWQRVTGKKYV